MEHKLILGGEKFLPFARSRIKALRATGLAYASQQFEIDGVSVKVRIEGAHDYIRLEGSSETPYSGIVKGGDIIELPIPPESLPGTAPEKTMRSFKPTANCWQVPMKSDPTKSPSAFTDEKKLAKAADQYRDVAASMYSGLMTKAVQYLMGIGKPLNYGYKFLKCHGITLDWAGKPWLVEISSANGVLAKRLPIKNGAFAADPNHAKKEIAAIFGGLPTGGSFPTDDKVAEAIAAGGILQLLTPAQMSDFFTKVGYSDILGWSFSDTGSTAYNTCYTTDSFGAYQGYFYKLEILLLENSKTAELTEVSHGPLISLFNPEINVAEVPPFKFMDSTGNLQQLPATLVTLPTDLQFVPPVTILACHINGVLKTCDVYYNGSANTVFAPETGLTIDALDDVGVVTGVTLFGRSNVGIKMPGMADATYLTGIRVFRRLSTLGSGSGVFISSISLLVVASYQAWVYQNRVDNMFKTGSPTSFQGLCLLGCRDGYANYFGELRHTIETGLVTADATFTATGSGYTTSSFASATSIGLGSTEFGAITGSQYLNTSGGVSSLADAYYLSPIVHALEEVASMSAIEVIDHKGRKRTFQSSPSENLVDPAHRVSAFGTNPLSSDIRNNNKHLFSTGVDAVIDHPGKYNFIGYTE